MKYFENEEKIKSMKKVFCSLFKPMYKSINIELRGTAIN